jgi:hypothetical protein
LNYDLNGATVDIPFILKDGDRLRNGTILCNSGIAVQCYGSLGSQHAVIAQGADRATLDYIGEIKAGTWLILKSEEDFSTIDHGKKGEWVRVESVSGNTAYFEQFTRDQYTICYKPILPRILVEDVHFVGLGQYAIRTYLCRSPRFSNCTADGFRYSAFSLETCLGGHVEGCDADRGDHATGAAYGVSVVGGCDGVSVVGGRFSSLRHGVTIGGTLFTTRGTSIQGINAVSCSDAGVDAHPNSIDTTITGCTVEGGSTHTDQTGDGIVSQGCGTTVTGNIVRNTRREGIMIQTLTNEPGNCSVMGNLVTAENGIIIQHRMPWKLKASVVGNVIEHKNRGIQVESFPGAKTELALSANFGVVTLIGDVVRV